jgi:mannan endo-1,4-beta-mannosidase
METGLSLMPDQNWWTDSLLPVIKDSGMAYVMIWVNSRGSAYFGTFVGEPSANDFKKFHGERSILFLKNIKSNSIYNK